ncbi:MAG: type VI secretion protein ImpB [Planctomycetota bacterium]|nr:type VI secretion protein ImpB [Planctomycetota bacterium]
MNSYFASVEQHFKPELRGRRVAVVPVESENTSVIAASREAKRFGVRTGTRVGDARRMCPEIVLVKARPSLYVEVHHSILRSVDLCVPVHKVYSIDEWAIQLLGEERTAAKAIELGGRIKQQLLRDFSPWLTCSIGVAPSRLLAKIASDLQKPDGLTVLVPGDLPGRLEHFTLKDLCGIGGGMVARLNAHGIHSVRDLWAIDRRRSIQVWGAATGGDWWDGFHGHDLPERPTKRRSMSHASVLDPRFRNEEGAYGIMLRLLCRLGVRLRSDQYLAHRLSAYVKNVAGGGWHDEIVLPGVQDTPTLLDHFQRLWRRRLPRGERPLQVGVEVSGLELAAQSARPLFDEAERPQRVSAAIDKINQRWGKAAVYIGAIHRYRHTMDDKIAFGRIPPTG